MRTVSAFITRCCVRSRVLLAVLCVMLLHAGVIFHSSGFSSIAVSEVVSRDVLNVTMVSRTSVKDSASDIMSAIVSKSESSSATETETETSTKTATATATATETATEIAPVSVLNTQSRSPSKPKQVSVKENLNTGNNISVEGSTDDPLHIKPIHLTHPSFKGDRPTPRYPHQALSMRQEGIVIIRVLIDTKGAVIEALIEQSSGSEWLDKAAQKAALRAKFYPYSQNGVPQNAQAVLPFHFVIK